MQRVIETPSTPYCTPPLRVLRRAARHHARTALVLALPPALGALAACSDSPAPTAVEERDRPAAALTLSGSTDADGITAQGTIALPINQSISTSAPAPAFGVTQTGTGPNGVFQITNSNSSSSALTGTTNGPGVALNAGNTGTGSAGVFFTTRTTNAQPALFASGAGSGPALLAQNNSAGNSSLAGSAAIFQVTSTLSDAHAINVSARGRGAAGFFHKDNGSASFSPVLMAWNMTPGAAAADVFVNNSTSQAPALLARTIGGGWAGDFSGTTKGVRVTTNPGGAGLQVVGGSKNAVVGTSSGARALYAEEATEVFFTDYGFAQLKYGRAWVPLDLTFTETVNVGEPYHVFLEEYGAAELYVARRTFSGFEVVLKDGDPSAEFSYRIVAKRRGFEQARLERAPWADNAPGLRPRDR